MDPVAGPGVIVAQAVIHQDRQPQPVGLIDGKLEREVLLDTLGGLHPVKDQLAVSPRRGLLGGVDAKIVDGCHFRAARASTPTSASLTMLRSIPAKTSWCTAQSPYQ